MYAWIIDVDLLHERELEDYPSEVGVTGPRRTTNALLDELKQGKGKVFTMGDDDGIPYYRGRIVGDFDMTEPLDDFGTPNAGCTWISEGHKGQQHSIV